MASGTGSAATATGKASPTKSGAKPAPAAVEVMTTPEKNPKGIQFSDMKMFSGYKGGMATYVACRLTNGTGQKLPVVRVTIDGKDAGDKSVGAATVTLYNVPPGETVPVVAEWDHDEGAKAARWTAPVADVNPPGEPQDMPTLVASEAWPMKDSNSQSSTGRVKTTVTNKGLLTLPVVDMSAILVGEDGSIVGVAKGVVPKEVKPNVASDVTLPWDRTNGDLVKRAEVWVQAYR